MHGGRSLVIYNGDTDESSCTLYLHIEAAPISAQYYFPAFPVGRGLYVKSLVLLSESAGKLCAEWLDKPFQRDYPRYNELGDA